MISSLVVMIGAIGQIIGPIPPLASVPCVVGIVQVAVTLPAAPKSIDRANAISNQGTVHASYGIGSLVGVGSAILIALVSTLGVERSRHSLRSPWA